MLSCALFFLTMFPGRAPEGHRAIAGYVGGARAPELALRPAAHLIAMAHAEFGELLRARDELEVARVRHWPRGLPQLHVGHRNRVAVLRSLPTRLSGLFVTGNYFAGPSIASASSRQAKPRLRSTRFCSLRGEGRGPSA